MRFRTSLTTFMLPLVAAASGLSGCDEGQAPAGTERATETVPHRFRGQWSSTGLCEQNSKMVRIDADTVVLPRAYYNVRSVLSDDGSKARLWVQAEDAEPQELILQTKYGGRILIFDQDEALKCG